MIVLHLGDAQSPVPIRYKKCGINELLLYACHALILSQMPN